MEQIQRAAWSTAIIDRIYIDAPVEQVWDITIDIDRWHTWLPTVSKGKILDSGYVAVGSRFALSQPLQATKEWVVTELFDFRIVSWETVKGRRGFAARHAMILEGNGTRSILEIRFTQKSWVFDWLLRMTLRSAIARENKALKLASELLVSVAR